MHRLALGFLVLTGCLREETKYCSNGATCPFDQECTEVAIDSGAALCGPTQLVEQCRDKSEFDGCEYREVENEAVVAGACSAGQCIACTPETAGCSFPVWTRMKSNTNEPLNAVWVFARDDAYAVGNNGTILHYNGLEWRTIPFPELADVASIWGSDPSNLFVATASGSVVHGSVAARGVVEWTIVATTPAPDQPRLLAIHGSAPDNIVAVGFQGGILEFDGIEWNTISITGLVAPLNAVWAIDSRTAWACGNAGVILRKQDDLWTEEQDPDLGFQKLNAIRGRDSSETFVAGDKDSSTNDPFILQENAGDWATAPGIGALEHLTINALWAADGRLFGVGEANAILLKNDETWASDQLGGEQTVLRGIGGTTDTDLFVVGDGGVIARHTDL